MPFVFVVLTMAAIVPQTIRLLTATAVFDATAYRRRGGWGISAMK